MKSLLGEKSLQFPKVYRVTFSFKQIIRILLLIAFGLLIFRLIETILTIFIAFIIMAATKPAATFLNKSLRMSEGLAVGTVFVLVIFFFALSIYLIGRPLTGEVAHFIENIPQLSNNLVNWLSNIPLIQNNVNADQLRSSFTNILSNIANQFNTLANTLGNIVIGAFQGVLQTLFILVFSIYLYLERELIKDYIVRVFKLNKVKFNVIYDRIETQLGAWVRGQLLLGLAVGLATYLGLLLLDVKYALPLAILAGILEIVPVIGPIITGVILTLIGLTISPIVGLFSLLLSILIQQLENNFLVPIIMQKAVGLSPVVTIISILVGQELFGLLGAIIAVPTAAMLTVLVNTYLDDRDNKIKIKQELARIKEEEKALAGS